MPPAPAGSLDATLASAGLPLLALDLRVVATRLAGRVLFNRYWSIFGSTIIDLTYKSEDPLSLADGYEPVRHRIGIESEDACLELGLTWRRDYEQIGAFRKGSTFALHLALKGLGR